MLLFLNIISENFSKNGVQSHAKYKAVQINGITVELAYFQACFDASAFIRAIHIHLANHTREDHIIK